MKPRHFLYWLFWVLSATTAPATGQENPAIGDLIQMPRVVNRTESVQFPNSADQTAYFSPDGSNFILQTRESRLSDNATVDKLYAFRTRDVERSSSYSPPPAPLVVRVSHRNRGFLQGLKWLSNNELGFLSEDERGITQAFSVDVRSRRLHQLTRSETDVVSFVTRGSTTLYWARAPRSNSLVVPLANRTFYDLLFWDEDAAEAAPVRLYLSKGNPAHPVELSDHDIRLTPSAYRLWLSADARFAIAINPSTNVPVSWFRYRASPGLGFDENNNPTDPSSVDAALRPHYQLIDLVRGTSRALVDAPWGELPMTRRR